MSRPFSTKVAGFTLVELLVTLSIMTVVITVVIRGQTAYTESATLLSASDKLASKMSEVQAYGVAVKEQGIGTADFSSAYGISASLIDPSYSTSYIIFIDRNGNKIYDGSWNCPIGGSSECIEKVYLPAGDYIDSLCNLKQVPTPPSCNFVKRADVTFLRPNTDASIIFFLADGSQYLPANPIGERYALKSPSGLLRYVSVYFTGQITSQ